MSKPLLLPFVVSLFLVSSSSLIAAVSIMTYGSFYKPIDGAFLDDAFLSCLSLLREKRSYLQQYHKDNSFDENGLSIRGLDKHFWITWNKIGKVLNVLSSENPHLYALTAAADDATMIVNLAILNNNLEQDVTVWIKYWNRYCLNLYFDPKSIELSHFCEPCPAKEELEKYLNIYPQLKVLIFVKYFFQASNDMKMLGKIITEAQNFEHLSLQNVRNPVEEFDCSEQSALCIIL